MNQAELIKAVAGAAGVQQNEAEAIIKAVGEVARAELARGNEVILPGIGRVSVTHKLARKGRNPKTGAEINIPAKRAAKFTAAKVLKDALA